ncbi:hypothetical protein OAK16_02575 [Verrucomicrobia bacterium]|nr:hypothetical protein [Verrucomicrobiota bacterium]
MARFMLSWACLWILLIKPKSRLRFRYQAGKSSFWDLEKTGQVNAKALQHPPLVKLIEAGDVESGGVTETRLGGGADKGGNSSGLRRGSTGAMRQSGDR